MTWRFRDPAGVLVLACLAAAGAVRAAAPDVLPPPAVTAPRCAQAPALDGDLRDPCWASATTLAPFYRFGGTQTLDAVRARATWDDHWLYLAVEVKHPMPDRIRPAVLQRDGGVNQDDSIEVFLDPGTEGALYYHWLLNAANVRAEQRKLRQPTGEYATERQWDVAWRSAAKRTATGWQAELALPMSELAGHGGLDKLRLNVAGTIWMPVIDAQGVEIYRDKTMFTWSAIGASYHEPFRFGMLRGLEAARPAPVFLPAVRSAVAGAYVSTNGQYGYPVAIELQGFSPVTGAVDLVLDDRPLLGDGASVTARVALAGLAVQPASLFVSVGSLASRRAVLTLRDAADGEVLQVVHLTGMDHLNLVRTVYPDRSYYTTETQAVVRATISLPPAALAGCTLQVRDARTGVLGSAPAGGTAAAVPLALAAMPEGTHRLTFALLDPRGAPMIEQAFDLTKRPPKPGLEWKTDRYHGVLLDNGVPFFPFGPVFGATNEANFREVAGWGMNSILRWTGVGQNPSNTAFHDLADRYGLRVMDVPDRYAALGLVGAKSATNFADLVDANMDRMLAGIDSLKDRRTLIGYYHFDEPGWAHQIDPARKLYRLGNARDGYHPWMVLYSSHIPEGDQWLDWSDIVGTDPYWVPAGAPQTGVRGTINWVSKITAWTRRRGDGMRHPTIIVPVGELWSGMRKRVILPEEQMCQSYLAVIHGAKGLFYFCYPFQFQSTMDTMARLGREFRTIGPIAVTPDLPQAVAYRPGEFDPDKDLYPDVQVALRRRPEGGYCLLAANARPWPVEAAFRIEGLADGTAVTRLFGDARYPVAGGAFREALAPYATRAYLFEAADLPEPARLTVETTGHPDRAEPVYADVGDPDSGRPGKRNLARNPSMETAAVPGCADYMIWLHDTWGGVEGGVGGPRFGRDTNTAWHGQASMKITARAGDFKRWLSWWPGLAVPLAPQVEKPTRFVFSVYLKAGQLGVKARLTGFDTISNLETPEAREQPEFELTTDWRRYQQSGVLPPGLDRHHQFGVKVYGEGPVWIDAVQVEVGAAPTAFEP